MDEDDEEQHYWEEQDEIDEEDEAHSRLRDAHRDVEVEGDEDSEVSGVALALPSASGPRASERGRSPRSFRMRKARKWRRVNL